MNKEIQRKKKETEEFFKDAFCAESVEFQFGKNLSDFRETGIIKIITGDNRDDFYVAVLKEI